jgi:hypothetical protein
LNKKKNKIAILIPYFGKWPEWIDIFFYSCSRNNEIDWIFLTDCEFGGITYSNVFFNKITFSDYCAKVSQILDIEFTPTNTYKLCSLKPFYGYIHQDLLANYDFWGFGDVDVIWGDIKSFYTDDKLKSYDVFSTHGDRISGHLAILRNTEYHRELCFAIKNWKEKLQNKDDLPLDEREFSWIIYPELRFVSFIYFKLLRKILNWRDAWVINYHTMPLLNRLFFAEKRKLYFKEQFTTPTLSDDGLSYKHDADTWYYGNGKITNNKTRCEYIYFHFMIYKRNRFRESCFWTNGYYNVPSEITPNDMIIIDKTGFTLIRDCILS